MVIQGHGTTQNSVIGDFIGSSANGDVGLGVQKTGIAISDSAATNFAGGTSNTFQTANHGTHSANLIFGNTNAGIVITGTIVGGNIIAHNYIGVNEADQVALPADQAKYMEEISWGGSKHDDLTANVKSAATSSMAFIDQGIHFEKQPREQRRRHWQAW